MDYRTCVCMLVVVLCAVGSAQGQGGADVGGGFYRLTLDAVDSDPLDGYGFGLRGWFPPAREADILRIFLGLRVAWFPGDSLETAIWSVTMITPEIGLSCRLGESPGLLIEPMVAAGAPMASFTGRWRTLADISDEDDFAIGWSVRPGLLFGYQGDTWAFGGEVSLGFLNVDFTDEANGTHEDLYVGLFFRH
jgi:hypothetical protein